MEYTIQTEEKENIDLFRTSFLLDGYLILEKKYPEEFKTEIWKKILELNIQMSFLINKYIPEDKKWKIKGTYFNDVESYYLDFDLLENNYKLLERCSYNLEETQSVMLLSILLDNYINQNSFLYYNNIFSFLRKNYKDFNQKYVKYREESFLISVDFYKNIIAIYFVRKD